MKEMLSLAQKKEILIQQYEASFDLEIARTKIPSLTDDEFDKICEDDYFSLRINLIDSEERERLIVNLQDLSTSKNENVKLKATIELGKMLYAKKFNATKKDQNSEGRGRVTVILQGKAPDQDGNT